MKAVRELGLERRETVDSALSINSAICWKLRVSGATHSNGHSIECRMNSENASGADNQQGRLESYLSGFADGEGSFSIGLQQRLDLPFGFQLVPEFRVSQNAERASILELFKRVMGCGRILENDRKRENDKTYVFVVRRRSDLIEKVIPFFRRNPLISEKRTTFDIFAQVVGCMSCSEHLTWSGFERLVHMVFQMNGNGRYRKWSLTDVIGVENPQRLYAEHPLRV